MPSPRERVDCVERTAKGKPCRGRVVEGSNPPMCSSHLGRAGRKTSLTPKLQDDLCKLLAAANYLEVALAVVALPRSTFFDWMQRGESSARADEDFRTFRAAVEKARAEGEALAVTQIAKAASKDWKAAAWMLERQFPERWAKSSPAKEPPGAEQTPTDAPADDDPFSDDPADELSQHREKRRGAVA